MRGSKEKIDSLSKISSAIHERVRKKKFILLTSLLCFLPKVHMFTRDAWHAEDAK